MKHSLCYLRTLKRFSFSVLLLVIPTLSVAQEGKPQKFWIGITGGFNTYSLSDLNDEIRGFNSLIAPLKMDEVTSGFALGANAGMQMSILDLSIGFERLSGDSKISDPSGSLEFNVPANLVRGRVTYLVPSEKAFRLGFAGSGGLVMAAGNVRISVTGEGAVSGDFEGSGPMVEGLFVGRYWSPSGRVGIGFSGGYRYAQISETKVNNMVIFNEDGSKYALDYSGLGLRVDLLLSLTQ